MTPTELTTSLVNASARLAEMVKSREALAADPQYTAANAARESILAIRVETLCAAHRTPAAADLMAPLPGRGFFGRITTAEREWDTLYCPSALEHYAAAGY